MDDNRSTPPHDASDPALPDPYPLAAKKSPWYLSPSPWEQSKTPIKQTPPICELESEEKGRETDQRSVGGGGSGAGGVEARAAVGDVVGVEVVGHGGRRRPRGVDGTLTSVTGPRC